MTTPAPGAVLVFEGVRVTVGGRAVLDGVDAAIPGHGVTVLVGPSGSGKSTLLRLANRLLAPTEGRVLFRGEDVAGLDPLAHRRRVGMVFQQAVPFAGTVRDNLLVADPGADGEAMGRALERAHLDAGFLERDASTLSGGESQRACVARALMAGPEVLLMDEPTSALDEPPKRALERLARELADGGVPVVWVTHDGDQARRLADWAVALDAGRVAAAGPPEAVAGVGEEGRRAGG
ncbi:MAG: ATP-binding cassette domain-containing protein [Thermoleophilia bacterium]